MAKIPGKPIDTGPARDESGKFTSADRVNDVDNDAVAGLGDPDDDDDDLDDDLDDDDEFEDDDDLADDDDDEGDGDLNNISEEQTLNGLAAGSGGGERGAVQGDGADDTNGEGGAVGATGDAANAGAAAAGQTGGHWTEELGLDASYRGLSPADALRLRDQQWETHAQQAIENDRRQREADPQWVAFQNWQREQAAAQPAAPEVPYKLPFQPQNTWQTYRAIDPATGREVWTPDTPDEVKQQYNANQAHMREFSTNFLQDPTKTLEPIIEHLVSTRLQGAIDQRVEAVQEKQHLDQFWYEHCVDPSTGWMADRDQTGQLIRKPNGDVQLNDLGLELVNRVQFLMHHGFAGGKKSACHAKALQEMQDKYAGQRQQTQDTGRAAGAPASTGGGTANPNGNATATRATSAAPPNAGQNGNGHPKQKKGDRNLAHLKRQADATPQRGGAIRDGAVNAPHRNGKKKHARRANGSKQDRILSNLSAIRGHTIRRGDDD